MSLQETRLTPWYLDIYYVQYFNVYAFYYFSNINVYLFLYCYNLLGRHITLLYDPMIMTIKNKIPGKEY